MPERKGDTHLICARCDSEKRREQEPSHVIDFETEQVAIIIRKSIVKFPTI